MLNSSYNWEGCVLTFHLFQISESETSNACHCFRKLLQFAADSESERMYILLLRRIVQKSRKKMWAVATSEMHTLGKNLAIAMQCIEAYLVISATMKEQAKLRLSCHPFPLHAGEHGILWWVGLDPIFSLQMTTIVIRSTLNLTFALFFASRCLT